MELLKEYLETVLDFEKNIYMQEKLKEDLKLKINNLGFQTPRQKPVLRKSEKLSDGFFFGIIAVFFGALITPFLTIFVFAIALGVILIILDIIGTKHDNAIIKAENDKKIMQYESLVHQDYLQTEKEMIEKESLECIIREINNNIGIAKSRLKKLYEYNVVFPKYRNLPMIASLYEYVASGRCTELEGHEGGYNILENEMRLDRIIVKMDVVISQLNTIIQNQFTLYTAISESNNLLQKLVDSSLEAAKSIKNLENKLDEQNLKLESINRASEVNKYFLERNTKELEYMNRMDYICGRNDATFFNIPPSV